MHTNDIVFVLGLAVLNIFGLWFANYFRTLVFLDTLATAMAGLAAAPFGLFSGMIVGLATNVLIGLKYPAYWKFMHVNVVCGLAWGLIGQFFPVGQNVSDARVIAYILIVGCAVGLLSAVLSVPIRIMLGFHTDHLLDQVSGAIRREAPGFTGLIQIFIAESLLSHLLDKMISTTVGVMYVLEIQHLSSKFGSTYHDMIELLAACYYVAMGYSIKALKIKFDSSGVVAVLGPLGFFSVLIALPIFMRALGAN